MNDRFSSHCHHQARHRCDDKYRSMENELERKTTRLHELRPEMTHVSPLNEASTRASAHSLDPSKVSRHASTASNWNTITKDREMAKLKALLYQKDNEVIALICTHKKALLQMEDRMERERKVWTEHKELLLAGERAKFEEEKSRLLKDLQHQCHLESERCQHLERKLYDAQMQSSEAKLMLKESGRERINAVYGTKEHCRKEFQDEINRFRHQFQLEKNAEFERIQERVRELEENLNQISSDNVDGSVRQRELYLKLETAEKACVRSLNDSIKKLLMAMDTPSHVYTTLPHVSSFVYDRDSVVERAPTRATIKLLQDTIDDVRKHIAEQRAQMKAQVKAIVKQPRLIVDTINEYPNRTTERIDYPPFIGIDVRNDEHVYSDDDQLSSEPDSPAQNPFQFSSKQNDTIDNLVQKLENHIADELDRLTKQRFNFNDCNYVQERSTTLHLEAPKTVKFESDPCKSYDNLNQDTLIRHLQSRISDLREDNMRLRKIEH